MTTGPRGGGMSIMNFQATYREIDMQRKFVSIHFDPRPFKVDPSTEQLRRLGSRL